MYLYEQKTGFADACPANSATQYHKFIIPRATIGIFIYTKFVLPLPLKCDYNALIFSLIGHESSELREFYKMYPEMDIFVVYLLWYCKLLQGKKYIQIPTKYQMLSMTHLTMGKTLFGKIQY